MSYLALYREFRPSGFDSLVGQEHVVQTLVNQIKTNRVGHAYLFCGARGTGKTSAAKIFAKAINCLSPKNGSPCGECEVCKRLAEPTNLDIVEMDAASNNKVENVRDLRDKIQYPPVAGKYKVYIVDEVHMLTPEAFNALLKTLEEPPEHAVFILATTEVQKLPSTILSRCLRFDFKLIPTQKIAEYVCKIYDKVGKKYQKEAVDLIARAGEGSMRDALSVADVCVSYSEGVLTYDDVLEVLGASDRTEIEKTIGSMLCGNPGDVLTRTEKLCGRGKSVGVLCSDVCSALRDLLIIKTCADAQKLLSLPDDKFIELKKLAESADEHRILRSIEIFAAAEADLKYSTHPKIVFETAALKASMPENDYNVDALISRINALEDKVKRLSSSVSAGAFDCGNKAANIQASVAASEKCLAQEDNKTESLANNPVKKTAPDNSIEKKLEKAVEKNAVSANDEGFENAKISRVKVQNFEYSEADIPPEEPDEFCMPMQENPAYKPVNDTFGKKSEGFEDSKKTNGEQVDDKKQTEKQSGLTEAETANCDDPRKAWGMVLRNLRADKEIMLWVACQDVDVRAAGKTLFVLAGGSSEYNLLIKPANLQKLGGYVLAACGLQTRVVANKAELEDALSSSDKGGEEPVAATSGLSATFGSENEKSESLDAEENAVKQFFGEQNVQITD